MKSPIVRITALVLLTTLYSFIVVYVDIVYLAKLITIKSTVHSLLALVLGGLLVFRTNTAYDRWWEGRKLWGQLVNDSRNLSIKIKSSVQAPQSEKLIFARKLVSFSYALKGHLREGVNLKELDGFENEANNPTHVPAYITGDLYRQFENWKMEKKLDGVELLFLDSHASSLMNICGACERIKNTPIATSWRTFIRQIIAIYLLTLPWGLIEDMGYWTVPISLLVAYFMIGLEAIAEDIEQPFGTDHDDLDLDGYCASIRKSVLEIVN